MLGISDVQWPSSGKANTENGTMYFEGNNDPTHRYGIGIIVDKEIYKSVINFTPHSDRILMIQISMKKANINIILITLLKSTKKTRYYDCNGRV